LNNELGDVVGVSVGRKFGELWGMTRLRTKEEGGKGKGKN